MMRVSSVIKTVAVWWRPVAFLVVGVAVVTETEGRCASGDGGAGFGGYERD